MANEQTTALDILYKLIVENDPAAVGKTFKGYTPMDINTLVRELNEGDGHFVETFAPGVSVEVPVIEVGVRGAPQDYATPRNEAIKLRNLITKAQNVVMNDIMLLRARPVGNILSLGRDDQRRAMFSLRFMCYTQTLEETP